MHRLNLAIGQSPVFIPVNNPEAEALLVLGDVLPLIIVEELNTLEDREPRIPSVNQAPLPR